MVAEPMFAGGQLVAGIQRLVETPIVINGQAPSRLIWRGRDASAAGWPEYGGAGTLTLAGSGSDPSYQQPVSVKEGKSCLFTAGKFFQAGDNDLADITTEDVIIEIFKRHTLSDALRRCGKYSANYGWLIAESVDRCSMGIGNGTTVWINSAVIVPSWILLHYILHRSGYGQCYVNASVSGAAVDISGVGSITVAQPLQIGAAGGISPFDGDFALLLLVKQSGLLNSHLQSDFVRERLALLTGHRFLRHASGLYTPEVL